MLRRIADHPIRRIEELLPWNPFSGAAAKTEGYDTQIHLDYNRGHDSKWEKVEAMTWVALDSGMLSAAAYEAEKEMLYLRFRMTGDVYRYFEFPKENYREFLDAESHGHYFLNHIRHDFRYERLARLTAA